MHAETLLQLIIDIQLMRQIKKCSEKTSIIGEKINKKQQMNFEVT